MSGRSFEKEIPVNCAEELRSLYPDLWATASTMFPNLSIEDKERIVSLARGICGSCHDAPLGCQCWNDE